MLEAFEDQRKLQIPKGQILLYPGDSSDYIYFLASGLVRIYQIDDEGNEGTILFLKKGMMAPTFVDMFSLKTYIIQYFYEAFTDVEVYKVDRAEFIKILDSNFKLLKEITQSILSTKGDAINHSAALQNKTAREKVYRTLHYLNYLMKDVDMNVKFTQQDIAAACGLTRETVSNVLNEGGINARSL